MGTSFFMTAKGWHPCSSLAEKFSRVCPKVVKDLLKPCIDVAATSESLNRRRCVVLGIAPLIAVWTFDGGFSISPSKAVDYGQQTGENEEDRGILDTVRSIFDPNEKTKFVKVLPKAYSKSAREVAHTLRESLKEDTTDIAKFRKTADAAKESIREYFNGWRGQQVVKAEESYAALEKAIRSCCAGVIYSKAGPFAPLSEDAKASILNDLDSRCLTMRAS